MLLIGLQAGATALRRLVGDVDYLGKAAFLVPAILPLRSLTGEVCRRDKVGREALTAACNGGDGGACVSVRGA